MKLTAQLLTVMDSNKLALQSYVVPSGKTASQSRMLEYLVSKQRNVGQIRINTVSVDNASQVAPSLKQHYHGSTGQPLTVLQDLWHARERIEREFNTDHPLIKYARSVDQLIVDLGTGKEYCHTKRLHYWLSTQPGLNGVSAKIIEKKLN